MEFISDEALAIFVPILVYWVYSGMYMALGQSMDRYRLHPRKEEDSKNLVSKREVIKGVLLQQLVQAGVAAVVFTVRTSPYVLYISYALVPTMHISEVFEHT
jgi:sphinganine C4-monooxygenase